MVERPQTAASTWDESGRRSGWGVWGGLNDVDNKDCGSDGRKRLWPQLFALAHSDLLLFGGSALKYDFGNRVSL